MNPRPAVVSVAITPATPSVVQGQNLALTANVTVVGGASTAVTWSSSNTTIVTVNNTGTITGVAVGSASVTATSVADPTKSATVPVTVTAPPPAVVSVGVTPPNGSLQVGATLQLTANVTVISGAPTTVTWSTSNAAVATVSGSGLVTGVSAGSVTVTATSTFDATKSGSASLTVNPPPVVNSVTVTSPNTAIIVGTTAQLAANVSVSGGASTAVTWSSSAPGVATVNASGLVTAVAPGNVTITATSVFDPTKSGSVALRVDATAIVNSVSVTPSTLSVAIGNTGQLTATVSVGNNASTAVTWSSSAAATATVDQTGKVTGVAAGTANIRATSQADPTKFAQSVVTVTGSSFPSIAEVNAGEDSQFSPPTVEIAVSGTVTWNFASLTHNVNFGAAAGAPANIGNSTNTSVSRTFNTVGTFTYDCSLHGGMTGRVIVH
ncbi:MAG TPA: Ig-like domain-containing protein [Gemmatimonadaceae bacterium]|nr:Ig-like domain-containing protein [Gemmatimonadaceae bacterium]